MRLRRVRRGAIGLSVTLLLLPAADVASADPIGSIAFSSTRTDGANAEIFVMKADGSDQTQVTNDPGSDVDPTWSPDGASLAFTRVALAGGMVGPGTIWSVAPAGTDARRLTAGVVGADTTPSWSPDGTRIAFTRTAADTRKTDVWVMDANGGTRRRLTRSAGFDGYPAWSGDAQSIVYTSDREGNAELYTMDANGTDKHRLTRDEGADTHPAWSPDGRSIAFISDRAGSVQLYVMPAAGGAPRLLTSGTEGPGNPAGGWAPAWSPDSTRLAFTADFDGNFDIVTISADGGPVTALTSAPEADFAPSWVGPSVPAAPPAGVDR
jgi:Tol biopolymer transport system component